MKKRIFAVLLALTLVLGLMPDYSAQVEAADTEKIGITSAEGLETVTWTDTLGMDKLYDGNRTSFFAGVTYATDEGPDGGAYVELTLEETCYVSEVDLYTRIADGVNVGCPKEFTISAYTGSEWIDVATGSDADLESYNANVGLIKVNFALVMCSKVKITITKLGKDGNDYCIRMNEIEVCGTSAKLAATASTNMSVDWANNAGLSIDKVYDGNITGTYFAGATYATDEGPDGSAYVELTLEETCYVSEVDLYTRKNDYGNAGCPKEFTISAYTGSEWIDVATGSDVNLQSYAAGGLIKVDFNPVMCNKVKITITKLGTEKDANGKESYCFRMNEIIIYGTSAQLTKLSYTPSTNVRDNGWISGNEVSIGSLCDGVIKGDLYSSYISQNKDVNNVIYTDQTNDLYIQLDFGADTYCEVDQLDFYSMMSNKVTVGFPAEYTITAHTPMGWVVVAEGDDSGLISYGASVEKKTMVFDPIWCNSIKINISKLGKDADNYCIRMSELEVFGRTDSGDLFAAHNLSTAPYTLPTNVVTVNGVPTEDTVLTTAYDYFIHTVGNHQSVVLYTRKDAHPDSNIDVCDLVAAIKAKNGIALTTQAGLYGADVDGNGAIEANDIDSIRETSLKQ